MAELRFACDWDEANGDGNKISPDEIMELMPELKKYVDVFEIGAVFVHEHGGIQFIRKLRKAHPDIKILADLKHAGKGNDITKRYIAAGADALTMMAMANDGIIKECVQIAHDNGVEILVDMSHTPDFEKRAAELESFGVDYLEVSIHPPKDENGLATVDTDLLERVIKCKTRTKISCSAEISLKNLQAYLDCGPDQIIVGKPILTSGDTIGMTKKYAEIIHRNN